VAPIPKNGQAPLLEIRGLKIEAKHLSSLPEKFRKKRFVHYKRDVHFPSPEVFIDLRISTFRPPPNHCY